jgi:ABC-2 type transport system permease protein
MLAAMVAGIVGTATLGQVTAVVVGVLVVGTEYGSGTVRVTFAANPRRLTVFAAKVVVAVVVCPIAFVAPDAST